MTVQRPRCYGLRRMVMLAACCAALLAAPGPPGTAGAQEEARPTLLLEPDRGPCAPDDLLFEPRILARGAGFPPGQTAVFSVGERTGHVSAEPAQSRTPIADDGTFVTRLQILGCNAATRDGTEFSALVEGRVPNSGEFRRARAIFTVDHAAPPLPVLPRPILTLEPGAGACEVPEPRVVARGALFPPGQEVHFTVTQGVPARGGQLASSPPVAVAGDGTFTAELRLPGCNPETPTGTEYRVAALTDLIRTNAGTLLARAAFTVAAAAAPLPGPPNTSGGVAQGARPVLTIEPERGPCDVADAAFDPRVVAVGVDTDRGGVEPPRSRLAIADDGTFVTQLQILGCDTATPDGAQFGVAIEGRDPESGNLVGARAIFTVDRTAPPLPALPRPTLTLEPGAGPCTTAEPRLAARGASFPPGQRVYLSLTGGPRARDKGVTSFPPVAVAEDGTFTAELHLPDCDSATPAGTEYHISGRTNLVRPNVGALEVRVTFTVDAAAAPLPGLPNTGAGGPAKASRPPLWGLLAALAILTLPVTPRLLRKRRSRASSR